MSIPATPPLSSARQLLLPGESTIRGSNPFRFGFSVDYGIREGRSPSLGAALEGSTQFTLGNGLPPLVVKGSFRFSSPGTLIVSANSSMAFSNGVTVSGGATVNLTTGAVFLSGGASVKFGDVTFSGEGRVDLKSGIFTTRAGATYRLADGLAVTAGLGPGPGWSIGLAYERRDGPVRTSIGAGFDNRGWNAQVGFKFDI